MMNIDGENRFDDAIARGRELEILIDGRPLRVFEGETVAVALLAAGQRALRTTARRRERRGMYCGIGVCFECVMTIDGCPNVRTCQTYVRAGMRVESQCGEGTWKLDAESSTRDASDMGKSMLIELFIEGCPACGGWLAYAQELASSAQRYALRVWDPRDEREALERDRKLALYGIKELPAIVVDGELLTCCK